MRFRIQEPVLTRQRSVEVNINDCSDPFVQLIDLSTSPPNLQDLVNQAWKGFKKQSPILVDEGVGGTYFMPGEDSQYVGVFKPCDEEAYNVNNPKGLLPTGDSSRKGYKEGILTGEASVRECAAYALDHEGFSGVPATDLVLCHHPSFSSEESKKQIDKIVCTSGTSPSHTQFKLGSFQEFKTSVGCVEDINPFVFPVDEVHKIAALDIRIFNMDRHEGNILYNEETDDKTGNPIYSLIPIDHGYSLPNSLLAEAYFCWHYWPQAKQKMSPRTKAYIASLDAEKDIALLSEKFPGAFRSEHFDVLRMTTLLLKKGAAADATFFDLANLLCRRTVGQPSALEDIVERAKTLHKLVSQTGRSFFEIYERLLDEHFFEKVFAEVQFY